MARAVLPAGGSVLGKVAALGADVLKFVASVVIAGFLFLPGPRLAAGARAFASRLIAPRGAHFVDLAGATALDRLPQGSACIANAYTSNHDALQDPEIGAFRAFVLHTIDATGLVHAALLRLQALILPVRALVLSGGH